MRARALNITIAAAGLITICGCTTFEDGQGFAGLSGTLRASFAGLDNSAGRVGADGWFKADNSFELKLTSLTLSVRDLRLQAAGVSKAAGSCTFDPQSPPSGCGLCHGGHCHCGGKLVSYEDLKAQACSSGAASVTTVVTLPVGRAVDLLAKKAVVADLSTCRPSCELGSGQVDRALLRLDRLTLAATLRDESVADRLSGKQYAVKVDWDLGGAALEHSFAAAQKMNRQTPYRMDLAADLPVARTLLDGVAWHQLSRQQGEIRITRTENKAAGETLSTNLAATKLAVTVTRSDTHDGGPGADGGEDVNAEACGHLTKGPFSTVTAGADAKSAPTIKAGHDAYRVSLSAGKVGHVGLAAADKGDHLFYLNLGVKLALQDDKGKAVAPEKSEGSVKACAEVKAKHTVELPAAGTYYLKLGPEAADATVTLVIEAAGHTH